MAITTMTEHEAEGLEPAPDVAPDPAPAGPETDNSPAPENAGDSSDPTDQSDPTNPTDVQSDAETDDRDSLIETGSAEDDDSAPSAVPDAPPVSDTIGPVEWLEYLPPAKAKPGADPDDDDTPPAFATIDEARAALEGFLFTTNEPLSVARIGRLMGNLHPRTVQGLLHELRAAYAARALAGAGGVTALQVMEVAGGWQLATRPHLAEWMFRLHRHRRRSPLSPATLETLAIVAYRQPVTKGDIEAIRGVESSGTMRTLQDLSLVDVGGRREVAGRPLLYVTTPAFLKAFGLVSLADLPTVGELRSRFAAEEALKPMAAAPPPEPVAEPEPEPELEPEPESAGIADDAPEPEAGVKAETDTREPEEASDPANPTDPADPDDPPDPPDDDLPAMTTIAVTRVAAPPRRAAGGWSLGRPPAPPTKSTQPSPEAEADSNHE